jgi:ornithine cyclodeaminase
LTVELRILSSEDVSRALPMAKAIDLMRDAFIGLSSGRASVPARTLLRVEQTGCRTLVMPGHLDDGAAMGLKVVSIQDRNPARGIPTIHGLMLVLDPDTGRPIALLEAERLTAIRTGAACGLATKLLATADASVLAIFGAGRQAMTQLEAVSNVRPIERVYSFTRSIETAERFAATMSERLKIDVVPALSRAPLRDADIICAATTSAEPVFDMEEVKPGAHVNAIGSFTPDFVEIPPELVSRAAVFVDQKSSCLREAGELVQAIRSGLMQPGDIRAEVGEVAAGTAEGRTSPGEITVFKSVGNAVQDIVAAAFVVERAESLGLGATVSI